MALEWTTKIQSNNMPLVITFKLEATPYSTSYFASSAVLINPVIWGNVLGRS